MSAAAPPTSLPRTPSRRQPPPSYNNTPDRERPHRTQSTTSRSAAPSSPRRSMSSSQAPSAQPPPSHSRTPSSNLANVARKDYEQTNVARPSSSRRSESHDRPSRTESSRPSGGHSRTNSRYNSEQPTPAAAPPPSTNGTEGGRSSHVPSNSQNLRRRTTIDAQTGSWELGKTIGAGSMGKVKLARNKETGEQVAVKIIPRHSNDGEHRSAAERERADHSKEIRTAREAAIVTLVDHPYICGMRDVVRTNYHWYMLFEYVNGGQMLDYIISHGRLKEKQARKFGRQIVSALDYCHRNSIVHRDLKIENILISKTGDIKIIDFGLSNLFSPRSHLKTFCGSLYFAAPELLQAKQYTGPEVDVWSFGIVLYVLVCGKVPFDDQSMPQLHAKIKKGVVEYPPWLSPECRNLIARMLTTDPTQRATLAEIMVHPWITKGFGGAPENYLPSRKPLQMPLDSAVIDKMTGFDFGAADIITGQMSKIIEGEDYQRAVRNAERRSVQPTPDIEKKRGVFDFYKRRNSTAGTSRDTLNTPSLEAVQLGSDPINAFSPLISIYYLAKEKQDREAREKNPGALALPQSPGEKPLKLPDLPAPPAAYTNSAAYEMAGEKPTGGRSRPRARTHGEDDVEAGVKNIDLNNVPAPTTHTPVVVSPQEQQPPHPDPPRRESAAVGLLRRFSTRRHKDPTPTERPERSERSKHPPPSLAVFAPSETPKKSFSVRRTRDRDDASATRLRPESRDSRKEGATLTPPGSGGGDANSDKGSQKKGLGRSVSVNSTDFRRRLTRRGVSDSQSIARPPLSSHGSTDQRSSFRGSKEEPKDGASLREAASDAEATTAPKLPPTTASRAKSMGHARRESFQARRAGRQDRTRTSNVPEETDAELQDEALEETGNHSSGNGSPNSNSSGMKPVYLKGLFSVSTTSSKPLNIIRADIIRVLRQLGVEYKEIKGGFACRHSPSIEQQRPGTGDEVAPSGAVPNTPGHKRKISFGGFMGNSKTDSEASPRPTCGGNNQRDYSSDDDAATTSNEDLQPRNTPRASQHQGSSARAAGETTTHVQSDLGSSMAPVRFEIFVVKVPLLSLHGIQFKKVEGGTWAYKNMAQRILEGLRL